MIRSTTLILTAAVALVACGPRGATPDDAATTPTDAQRAATVANAMRATPAKSDSILTANGLTSQTFEDLMYRVAADSAQNAEFLRLTNH